MVLICFKGPFFLHRDLFVWVEVALENSVLYIFISPLSTFLRNELRGLFFLKNVQIFKCREKLSVTKYSSENRGAMVIIPILRKNSG